MGTIIEDEEAIDTILGLVQKHRERIPNLEALPLLAR